jgi:hypothetical protein
MARPTWSPFPFPFKALADSREAMEKLDVEARRAQRE